ncbi:MAG: alpha amylase C-terminal domain-containing protein [Magnetococcales bacterium]|nr:alpha amylase C-terminal domain-containing protein [Magnetococcales bacterium]
MLSTAQDQMSENIPLGATLVEGGATFRVWAPNAKEVYIALNKPANASNFIKHPDHLLFRSGDYWHKFVPGVQDGDGYRFYVVGSGSEGFKRDPYARELQMDAYPPNCIVRKTNDFPWHDNGFSPPEFNDLVIYQFHIGVFYAKDNSGQDIRHGRVAKILDVVDRIEYFQDLGVNAVLPLPFNEYQTPSSLGYNGTDLFAPERDYTVRKQELGPYITRVNRLLRQKGCASMTIEQLTGPMNQFKAFVDLCHLYGIAVLADVVYNHGGGGWDEESIKFFDRQPYDNDNNSLYYTNQDHASGRVFAFWQAPVQQYLIDNGKMLLLDYHLDGLRYDQVTVMAENGGWYFAQNLANTLRYVKPNAVQIAEYWGNERWRGVTQQPDGMGFDIGYDDSLRDAIHQVLNSASFGMNARLDLDRLKNALETTLKYPGRWSVLRNIENHDILYARHTGADLKPRIVAEADPSNPRSWYGRSRAKVATGLLLTAPGVPMMFMGQEFLEDKYWSDDSNCRELLIWWAGLEGQDKAMSDQHRFTREMIWLRRKHPALRADGLNVFHVHNDNRVVAYHRWIPGFGRDVVVVASFRDETYYNHSYRIGFPQGGHWIEVFNSDVFDQWFNPHVQGNSGGVTADGPPWDNLPTSAEVTLPANSILVFARDWGDF